MKNKIYFLIFVLLGLFVVGCSNSPPYYEEMDKLEEPLGLEIYKNIIDTEVVYASHEMVLNEDEILYYIPESARFGNNIYINSLESGYYIFNREKVPYLSYYNYRIATKGELRIIFEDG